jgi:hypothetical protein
MTALRRVVGALCASIGLALVASTVGASAAAADAGTQLQPGWTIVDATVTGPQTVPRHLDSRHAAAFVQAWFPATIFGSLKQQRPPGRLRVFTVVADEIINGAPYKLVAYYASDGKAVWTGLPKQTFGPGASIPKEKWFIAPPRTIAAFEGKLAPIDTGTTPTPSPAPTQAAAKHGSDNSSGWLMVCALGAALAIGIAILALVRARARPRARTRPRARASTGADPITRQPARRASPASAHKRQRHTRARQQTSARAERPQQDRPADTN